MKTYSIKHSWIQLRNLNKARVLLILPCNAAACVGNYFRVDVYSRRNWNTWREADMCLHDLREKGLVAFAAVDSSTMETQPEDSRGAIVLETEMNRVRNPEGEDWGTPSWRWFRPNRTGNWKKLAELTEALVAGVKRVDGMGFSQVFTLVNPRAYFLALTAAVIECGLLDSWVIFRSPAHPRYLIDSIRQVAPFVGAAAEGSNIKSGIYHIPDTYPILQQDESTYRHILPNPWKRCNQLPNIHEVKKRWASLVNYTTETALPSIS